MIKIVSKGKFSSIKEFTIFKNKKVGSGSFGVVKMALHKMTNTPYALKIIDLNNIPTQLEAKLIEREIQIHSELEHPNIIKLWDTLSEGNEIYMVLEFAEKGNLFYYQNTKNVFSQAEAFRFFSQTLDAVSYLHSKNIIHRDIKPQNVLLDHYSNVKICDFGWSGRDVSAKRTTFCGTYEYMAPQMLYNSQYNYKVDIWALGILLYELLHGFAPFKGKNLEQVQSAMLKGSYQLQKTLTSNVKDLIQKILQFNPQHRIQIRNIIDHSWMKQMSQILNEHLTNENIIEPIFIHQTVCKISTIILKQKCAQLYKTHHHKNNTMDVNRVRKNININEHIDSNPIVQSPKSTKMSSNMKKRHCFHSQDHNFSLENDDKIKGLSDFKFQKTDIRCKTQKDQNIQKQKESYAFYKMKQNKERKNSDIKKTKYKINQNYLISVKSNDNLRRQIQIIQEKPTVRFNTEANEKQEVNQLVRLRKMQAKTKMMSSGKNLGKIIKTKVEKMR